MPDTLHTLKVTVEEPGTRLEILDGLRRVVDIGPQREIYDLNLLGGVYSVRYYIGKAFSEKKVILDSPEPVIVTQSPEMQPSFATAAPVSGTFTSREWHQDPAHALSHRAPITVSGMRGEGSLLLFLRRGERNSAPMARVTLASKNGASLFDLQQSGCRDVAESWIGAHLQLDAGAYFLRVPKGSIQTEQMIWVTAGWQTQIFLYETKAPLSDSVADVRIDYISILMARSAVGFDPRSQQVRWVETSLRALENRSNIDASLRWRMLTSKFENPILGVYAGFLHLRRTDAHLDLLVEVYSNLRDLLGMLPDVAAFGLGVQLRSGAKWKLDLAEEELREIFRTPPMLRASWEVIVDASVRLAIDLVDSKSLLGRLDGALIRNAPWLTWKASDSRETAEESPVMLETSPAAYSASDVGDGLKSKTPRLSLTRRVTPPNRSTPALETQLHHLRYTTANAREELHRKIGRSDLNPAEIRFLVEVDFTYNPAFRHEVPDASLEAIQEEVPPPSIVNLARALATSPGKLHLWANAILIKLANSLLFPNTHLVEFAVFMKGADEQWQPVVQKLTKNNTEITIAVTGQPITEFQFLFLFYHPKRTSATLVRDHADRIKFWPEFRVRGAYVSKDDVRETMHRIRSATTGEVRNLAFNWPLKDNWAQTVLPDRLKAGMELLPDAKNGRSAQPGE